ncbi:MAG: hypothetical protein D6762_08310, partial [Candidatus Neomarinimicrobiota bacterium]
MSRAGKFWGIMALCWGMVFGQTQPAGFGSGNFATGSDPSALGNTPGLLMDLDRTVSTKDPSTWRWLRYSVIRAEYGGYTLQGQQGTQAGDQLRMLQFILPVKQKFAFGLGISPYLDQGYDYISDPYYLTSLGDSLQTWGYTVSSGGLSEAYLALGAGWGSHLDWGILYSRFFGSRRVENALNLNANNYVQWMRDEYSGSRFQVFLTVKDLSIRKRPAWVQTSLSLPLAAVSSRNSIYQLFQDANQSGINDDFYDLYDFPTPTGILPPRKQTYHSLHAPVSFNLAIGLRSSKSSQWMSQVGFWQETASRSDRLSPLSSPVQQNWNGALHWMHYPKEFSKGWESRLRYSVGT